MKLLQRVLFVAVVVVGAGARAALAEGSVTVAPPPSNSHGDPETVPNPPRDGLRSSKPSSVHAFTSTSEAPWRLTSTGAVDVALRPPVPPRRTLALELNPLAGLALHRWGGNIVVAPLEHHAIILNPFHTYARTYPINLYDDNGNPLLLPVQRFNGWGAELGYRYYTGRGGLRGLFLGPSLFADWMTVEAQDGSKTKYIYYGLAADVGYQALITDSISLSFGGGLQYGLPNKDIPRQGFQAKYYANPILLPRLLISIGWAL